MVVVVVGSVGVVVLCCGGSQCLVVVVVVVFGVACCCASAAAASGASLLLFCCCTAAPTALAGAVVLPLAMERLFPEPVAICRSCGGRALLVFFFCEHTSSVVQTVGMCPPAFTSWGMRDV